MLNKYEFKLLCRLIEKDCSLTDSRFYAPSKYMTADDIKTFIKDVEDLLVEEEKK